MVGIWIFSVATQCHRALTCKIGSYHLFLSMTVAGKKAKVTFEYEAQDQDELSLKMDDIIDVLGEEEPGWWKGQQGNKIGVFPSNFVELIEGNDIVQSKDKPVETKRKHPGLLLYAKKMLGCKCTCKLVLY